MQKLLVTDWVAHCNGGTKECEKLKHEDSVFLRPPLNHTLAIHPTSSPHPPYYDVTIFCMTATMTIDVLSLM